MGDDLISNGRPNVIILFHLVLEFLRSIFLNIFVVLRNLRWTKKVEEAFAILSSSDWLSILRSLLRLLLKELLCQTFCRIPFNLRPYCFLKNGFVFIYHVIYLCQDRVLKEGVGVKVELNNPPSFSHCKNSHLDSAAPASYMMGSTNGLAGAQGTQPLFSFGVISDVQYADIPDGRSFLGVPRYYRHSIVVLQRAVKRWNDQKRHNFVINFGDIVDGFCPKDQSLDAVRRVVDKFEDFNGPVYHMIGNHCLYNLPRTKLLPLLKIPSVDGRAYYDFSPTPEFRFVVLDGYDISAIGWPQEHPNTIEALKFLEERNPNTDKNSPAGLVGLERRFLMFNGAVGKEQLEWLDDILKEATKLKHKVVICCHLPLDPGSSAKEALLWNYDEVMSVVHQYNCVKVCLAGHDHKGGHSVDSHGIHHRVLEAALECPPGTDAYGYIDVYDDKLELTGTDRMKSTDMLYNPQADLQDNWH